MNGLKRGAWKKDKSERGLLKRGEVWYIRFFDQAGKIHVERVGPSKALALRTYQKRKLDVDEHRFFPGRNMTFDELTRDAIARGREQHILNHHGQKFHPGRYAIVLEWFKGRKAASITP
jgi:hypothetical protein